MEHSQKMRAVTNWIQLKGKQSQSLVKDLATYDYSDAELIYSSAIQTTTTTTTTTNPDEMVV
jgi:hypothetical protein